MYRLISGLGGAAAAVAAASASIKAYSDKVSQDTYVKRRNNDCKVMQYMFSHLFIPLPPQKKRSRYFPLYMFFVNRSMCCTIVCSTFEMKTKTPMRSSGRGLSKTCHESVFFVLARVRNGQITS